MYSPQIAPEPVWGIVAGLGIITLLVLVLPFRVKFVEHNLEAFFMFMGILSVSVSGLWSWELVIEAIKAPVMIGSLPLGIFQVVLIFGLLIRFYNSQFNKAITFIAARLNPKLFIFLMIFVLGLISSVISVIVTAVLLAEIVAALPLAREDKIKLVVISCFAVGLGAVLTPLGEPLSTILVQKLAGPPYNAGFTFPFYTFAAYIIPGVTVTALFGAFQIGKKFTLKSDTGSGPQYAENIMSIVVRAVKVYVFIAALILLGEGLKPIVIWFLVKIPAPVLFWINSISAVLDNATLTAIEINPTMALTQIVSITLGLLIAGGMLIPGNIPNIVAAARLKISMKEWAVIGLPIGMVLLVSYFAVLLPIMLASK
jgi:predicted cation transporter